MLRCYVTNRRESDVLEAARRAVADGVDMIQVREKDLETRALFELVGRIIEIARSGKTQVLVNDRLDVALAAGADGVHLPGNGLPAAAVRGLVRLVGVSAHSAGDVRAAAAARADFVIFGPVFQTPGKAPVGLERLREAVAAAAIPVLAIGGVTAAKIPEVMDTGAAGIAAIRMFQESRTEP